MATGQKAFTGKSQASLIAAILAAEPQPITKLQPMVPPALERVVKTCLAKDPDDRWQTAHDLKLQLEWIAEGGSLAGVPAPVVARRKSRERVLLGVLATTAMAAALLGFLYVSRVPEQGRIVRASIQSAENSSFSFGGFAVSPDGKRLAYLASAPDGKTLLWIRSIDSFQAQPLAGTEGAGYPFWSPDSRFVGFFAGNKLKKIEASGGPPETLCDAPFGRGGTWNREGVILFAPTFNTPLYRVEAGGGTATEVTRLDTSKGETSHRYPYFLPDGQHFLYLAGSPYVPKENPTNSIMVGSLDSKESKPLFRTRSNAIYASDHILFLRLNTLMAQSFDARRLELTGEALPIADHVREIDLSVFGLFSASSSGVLAYAEGIGNPSRQLIWVDRSGRKVGEVPGADAYEDLQISPDGKRLSFTLVSGTRDIWVEDIARSVRTRLTFSSASAQSDFSPIWSPDGLRIAYVSARRGKFGLYQRASDGSGNEEILLEATEQPRGVHDWSRDGKYVAFEEFSQGVWAIWMLPLFGERKPYPFLPSLFNQYSLRFSPDGKWVAYCSTETGRSEVYVVPFPGPGGKWQISTGGGVSPSWRRDGKEIFYLAPDNKLMVAEVKTTGLNFGVGTVSPLFENRIFRNLGSQPYDATADGQRFIINFSGEQPSAAISLVVNWNAEAKK
jgi:Tol biopolymer transport system component